MKRIHHPLYFFVSALFAMIVQANASCVIPLIDYAVVSFHNGTFVHMGESVPGGSEIKISCQLGYILRRGASEAMCRSRGSWRMLGRPRRFPRCVTFNSIHDGCGKASQTQIFGGENASLGEFPWMARMEIFRRDSDTIGLCGASLIHEQWVLTAAHCLTEGGRLSSVNLDFGKVNFSTAGGPHRQRRSGQKFVVHPRHGRDGFHDYDYGLVKLNAPVRLSHYVRKICLPDRQCRDRRTSSSGRVNVDGCRSATVAGWGYTKNENDMVHLSGTLKKLNVNILADSECVFAGLSSNLSNAKLCAGADQDGHGSCQGDSGGPLMCRRNKRMYAIGVVSYGSLGCGFEKEPTIYAGVCEILDWIRDEIAENSTTAATTTATTSTATVAGPVTCSRDLPYIENGQFNSISGPNLVGTKRWITCNAGYRLRGREFAKCRSNGSWRKGGTCSRKPTTTTTTRRSTTTTPRRCLESLPPVTNGFYLDSSAADLRQHGIKRTVQCYPGYRVSGRSFSQCNSGTWSRPGTCFPIGCSLPLPNVRNGRFGSTSGTNFIGRRISLTCNEGFFLIGPSFVECVSSGSWSQAGTCLREPTTTAIPQHQLDADLNQAVLVNDTADAVRLISLGAKSTSIGFAYNYTTLMVSARYGLVLVVRSLIQHGVQGDVNAKSDDGWTALMQASRFGTYETVRELLKHQDIDVNAKNHAGETALTQASYRGHYDIVRELLSHGASVNLQDDLGRTALILAVDQNHTRIAALLRQHGAIM